MPEGPRCAADLNAAWVDTALHASGVLSTGRVGNVTHADLGTGVGIMCEVVRVSLEYDVPEAGAPTTLIAKFPTADPVNLQVAHALFFYPREVAFYSQLAAHVPVRTPALFHAELDMEDQGFALLIEDLGFAMAGDQVAGASPEQTLSAMRALGALHGSWWGKVDTEQTEAIFDFANPDYCAAVQAGYEGFLEPALEKFDWLFSDYTKAVARALGPSAAQVLIDLGSRSRTLVHGDYRLDNLLFHPDLGEHGVAAVDWQISGRGSGLYDVAYILCNSVPTAHRREMEQALLKDYHTTLCGHGATDYSFDDCWTEYRLAVLSGLFVVTYTCGGMDLGNERGLAFVTEAARRVDAAIVDLEAGALLPG